MNLTIGELSEFALNAIYNKEGKKTYLREAKRYMRELAVVLDLAPAAYSILVEPAGIAVPGNVTLHHERLYVSLGDCLGEMLGIARSCKGRKDYTGGQNNPILTHHSNAYLILVCREILRGAEKESS